MNSQQSAIELIIPEQVSKWSVYEVVIKKGPQNGNPFVEVDLKAVFTDGERTLQVLGFYDGEGVYRVRFMPDQEGSWTFRLNSSAAELDGI